MNPQTEPSAASGPLGDPEAETPQRPKPSRWRAVQPFSIAWLTLVWVTLWGEITPLLVVGGLLVSIVMCLVFPLPALSIGVTVHPLRVVVLVARFLYDVVKASIEVTGVVLRRKPVSNAIIAVRLDSSSDFVMAGVAAYLSLCPGSVVIEARRSTHTLYLHVIDITDAAEAEAFRAEAMRVEKLFVAAFTPKGEDS